MRISVFRLSVAANILGFVVAAVGFLLPWRVEHTPPGLFGVDNYTPGIVLLFGTFAVIAWLVGLLFQLLSVVRNRKYVLVVMCCGIAVAACSAIYILWPAYQAAAPVPPYSYAALYGVYITFAGGLIIAASSIIGFPKRHSV